MQHEIFKNENLTIRRNVEKHGIEVLFSAKPSEEKRNFLKSAGFRWSNPQKLWWARETDKTNKFVSEEIERQDGKPLENNAKSQEKTIDNMDSIAYNINSNNKNSIQGNTEKERASESNESNRAQASESFEPKRDDGRGSPSANVEELERRAEAAMGGDSRIGHARTGYGDDIQQRESAGERTQSSPDDSAVSDGQIQNDFGQTVGESDVGLRDEGLQEGGLVRRLPRHNGGAEPAGYGNERGYGLSETGEPPLAQLFLSITEENFASLKIKNGDVVKETETGHYWKVTNDGDFMARVERCNEDGSPFENSETKLTSLVKSVVGGGLKDLLGEGQFELKNPNFIVQETFEERQSENSQNNNQPLEHTARPSKLLKKNLTNAQSRDIREEVKKLLAAHTDKEIKADSKSLELLSQYEGGGGLKEQDATSAEALNAFYTPRSVIDAVWKIADHYAPQAKTVLEPTSGIGRFAENRPNNEFTLRELDETSARIAKILHPDANVIQGAFQAQFFDKEGVVKNKDYILPKYDLVIGNPPYGAYTGEWKGKGEGKEFDRYEEYFLKKGLESLNKNGILAFVVPSGFLNTTSDKQKELITESGYLLDAYRLPEGTFPTTKVGTDIVVFATWERAFSLGKGVSEIERQKLKSLGLKKICLNNYFAENPGNILGEVKTRINRFGKEEEYVVPHEGLSVQDELDKISRKFSPMQNAAVEETVTVQHETQNSQSEFAVKIADRYISIQEADDGFDYSILDENYKTIDGGQIDSPERNINETLADIVEDLKQGVFSENARGGITDSDEIIPIDYDDLTLKMEEANSIKEPAAEVAIGTRQKSNIEIALEKYLNPERDVSKDTRIRQFLGIKRDFTEKDFAQWSEQKWRGLRSYDFASHFDIATKQLLITTKSHHGTNGRFLFATIYPDGGIKKSYDEFSEDFKNLKLSKAKLEKLDNIFASYKFSWQPIMNSYLGMKDNKAYFAYTDAQDVNHVSNYFITEKRYNDDETRLFDSNAQDLREIFSENPYAVVLSERDPEEYDNESNKSAVYEMLPVFAKLQSVFPEDGKTNLSSIDEDNSFARLSGDEIEVPEEKGPGDFKTENNDWNDAWKKQDEYNEMRNAKLQERWNAALNEVVKMSGCSTQEEYFEKARNIINERKEKRIEQLEEKTKNQQKEQDANIVLNEVLSRAIKPGTETFEVYGTTLLFSQNKDDHNGVDIVIDGKKCLTLNPVESSITSYNDFYVTPQFIKGIADRWGGVPKVADIRLEDERLSLNKILEEKHYSKNDINKGRLIAETFIGQLKGKEELYEFERADGRYFTRKFGTVQKVFEEKSNYPLFEFDNKTNILKLYQGSFDSGIITSVEETFREKFSRISITKDIVIDTNRYVDTDGSTVIAPAKAQRYNPQKESLMDNSTFAKRYGKNWNEEERAFWAATDYKGFVDETKLSQEEKKALHKSNNYVLADRGTKITNVDDINEFAYIHKELFASGNIYKKLEENERLKNGSEFWQNIYKKNKEILLAALPTPLKIDEIEVSVNSPFVQAFVLNGEKITERFINWASGCNMEDTANSRCQIIDYNEAGISREDIPPTISWRDVVDFIDGKALPTIRDETISEKEKAQIRNRKNNDRRETAEKLFTRYIQNVLTKEEQALLSDAYNRQFNNNRDSDYSKLPLFVDGMNSYRKGSNFKLYNQQIKGISFLCNKGNGLLAYDVGVGKTAAGIVATVQQIQSGRSNKPLIIVPKSVIGKWESDIHELFPDIPVQNLGNLSAIATGAYYNKANHGLSIPDGSITLVTKEALYNMHWDKETVDKYLFNDYADLLGLTEELHDKDPKKRAETRERIYMEASGSVKDENYIEWKNTGFDHVTVDEAHAYRKLERKPRAQKGKTSEFARIVGSGDPSGIAKKMFNVTQIIQQQNENRNVFMLTATPFTNSPLEVYSMLVYVARKDMEACGIKNLNDFCSQYAKTRFERVVKPNGDVAMATVMKEWGDLNSLQNLLKQYIDKVDGEEAGIIRPEKKTHKVNLKATDLQKAIFDFAIEKVMTHVPDKDAGEKGAPVLEAMNMLRTACLSPALVKQEKLIDPETKTPVNIKVPPIEQVVECSPKLRLVCDTVISNWKKHKDCGQIIYMPEGTDAYPYVIDYMVKAGVPRDVFASIDGQAAKIGGKSVKIGKDDEVDDVRAKVAEAFNDKKNPCKILIGSAAISEGMDLNGNTVALYNTMMGWNPTECVQVEGRIWRQGNEQGHVHIVYPLIYDSIDSLLFQKHDEKGSRIEQLFRYKGKSLNVADLDPEQLKYELINDPVKRAKIKIYDEAVVRKNEILMIESRLGDYDGLVEAKIKATEKLAEKEAAKQSYIDNHAKSIAEGRPNRSEADQKQGLDRYDKSINDYKQKIENIKRKYAEMGIENDEDRTEYVNRLNAEKHKKEEELEKLYGEENLRKNIEKVKAEITESKAKEFENALKNPLDKTIQEDMIPFHIVEKQTMSNRYESAIKNAEDNPELQKELTEDYKNYLENYEKKHGADANATGKNVSEIQTPTETQKQKNIVPPAETSVTNIVNVIGHEIEVFERQRDEQATAQGMLFMVSEPQEVTRAVNSNKIDWKNTTCENFSDKFHEVFKSEETFNREAILKSAQKLISSMSNEERQKFVEITSKMNIKHQADIDDFLIKVAKGELKLQPWKNGELKVVKGNIPVEKVTEVAETVFETFKENVAQKNVLTMPEIKEISTHGGMENIVPFEITQENVYKQPSIKFNAKKRTPHFSEIIEELKRDNWYYNSTKQEWQSNSKRANDNLKFAKKLQEKWTSDKSGHLINKVEEKSPYEEIEFFERYGIFAAQEFANYANRHKSSEKLPDITKEEAHAILANLETDPKNETVRLGLKQGHLLLEKITRNARSGKTNVSEISISEAIAFSNENAKKNVENAHRKNEVFLQSENKQEYLLHIGNLYEQNVQKTENEAKLLENLKTVFIDLKGIDANEISEGDIVSDATAKNVMKIADGVFQLSLVPIGVEGNANAVGNNFALSAKIAEQISPEVKKYGEFRDSFFILDDKRADPYLMKELIDKKLCEPPKYDPNYYREISEYTKNKPIRYLALKPNTAANFKENLQIIARIDGSISNDCIAHAQKLISLADRENRFTINKFLENEGCKDAESTKEIFSKWCSECREPPLKKTEQSKGVSR